jgi:hypothetical protein
LLVMPHETWALVLLCVVLIFGLRLNRDPVKT